MNRRSGIACFVILGVLLTCGSTAPPACNEKIGPSDGEVIGAVIGVAAAIVVGTVVLVEVSNKSHHTVKGCVTAGPDGLISHDPHYPVWRAGANSATALHTDADITVGTLAVPKGDYTLFVDVSNPDQWVLIVSKATHEWGLAYDSSKDLGKTPMTMSKPPAIVENLKWTISGVKPKLTLAWEDHSASVSVSAH